MIDAAVGDPNLKKHFARHLDNIRELSQNTGNLPEDELRARVQEQYHALVQESRLVAVRDKEQASSAIVHELTADGVDLAASAFFLGKAAWQALQGDFHGAGHTLHHGEHFFVNAAATIPVFGSQIVEFNQAGENFRDGQRLHGKMRQGDVSPAVIAAASVRVQSMPTLLSREVTRRDRDVAASMFDAPGAKDNRKDKAGVDQKKTIRARMDGVKSFAHHTFKDWVKTFTPAEAKNIAVNTGKAVARTASIPAWAISFNARASMDDVAGVPYGHGLAADSKTGLDIRENAESGTISVSERSIAREIARVEGQLGHRGKFAAWNLAGGAGAGYFVHAGVAQINDIARNDFREADGAVDVGLAAALLAWKAVSVTLTLTPLKVTAEKYLRHTDSVKKLMERKRILQRIQDGVKTGAVDTHTPRELERAEPEGMA